MASPNPLIKCVQKHFPSLSRSEALDVIFRVRILNGGLTGLKIVEFLKLVRKALWEKSEEKRCNEKEKKKKSDLIRTCPICFSFLSTRASKERHMKVHSREDILKKNDEELPTIDERILENIGDKSEDIYDKSEEIGDKSDDGSDRSENISDKCEDLADKSEDITELDHLPEWRCKVCEKEYRHEVSLTRHLKEHDGIEPIPCDLCGKKCKRKYNLYAHKRKVHNAFNINFKALRNTEEHSNTCKMCGEAFASIQQFEAHIVFKVCREQVEAVKAIEEKYKCDLCDRSYKHKKSLLAHLDWKHRNKKTYECEICGVVYSHESSLVRHKKKLH